jgi:integrase
MNYVTEKITTPKGQVKHQLRIWFSGRGAKQIRRRFKSARELENFRLKLLKLAAVDQKLANRFLKDEPYSALIEEFKTPEKKQELAAGMTFGQAHDYWKKHQYPTFSPGWKATVDGYWKEISTADEFSNLFLEDTPINQISSTLIDDVVVRLRQKNNSQKTINQKVGWIQSVINFSVDKGRVEFNPVLKYKKTKAESPDIEFWEKDEAVSFLKAMNKKYPVGDDKRWIYAAYLTALNTGVRAGELWALKPECVKASLKLIRISEQFDVKSKEFRGLKGKEARTVPLTAALENELGSLIDECGLKRDDLFFGNGVSPVDHDNFSRIYDKDVEEWAGKRINFHSLRHTAATLLLASGVQVNTVQKILGHKSIETTMRYVHLLSTSVQEASVRFSLNAGERAKPLKTNRLLTMGNG